MYLTTGFSRESIVDLCAMIHNETMGDKRPWPPILGLFKSVTVALAYMRRNRVQEELAETYGVSQPATKPRDHGRDVLAGQNAQEIRSDG